MSDFIMQKKLTAAEILVIVARSECSLLPEHIKEGSKIHLEFTDDNGIEMYILRKEDQVAS